MKILQIFNRYAHVGGEEIAVKQIGDELAQHHEFREIIFDSSDWVAKSGVFHRIWQFVSMVWNRKAIRQTREILDAFRPDVVVLHNIMPVGSAGLFILLHNRNIPTIQYIHNFRPFSVNGYCWGNGRMLPQGLRKNFWPEIFSRSWQNSAFKTAWYSFILWLLHKYGIFKKIDGWIAISGFMRERFIEGGIDGNRIRVIRHSWRPRNLASFPHEEVETDREPTFLFLGRLTEEKGLLVLLDAWELFEKSNGSGRLQIAGDGPLQDVITARCARLGNATFLGFQTGEAKDTLLRNCTALIVPSIWWEPSGLVVYEAYDFSKPVLAARSGGLVDNVTDGETGWIHDPGDINALVSHLMEASGDRGECRIRGLNGRKLLRQKSPEDWIASFDQFILDLGIGRNGESRERNAAATRRPTLGSLREEDPALSICVYLADQNPGYDRSFGISRMTKVILDRLQGQGGLRLEAISSRTSQQAPEGNAETIMLPWGTRNKSVRLFTDHFHPLFWRNKPNPDIYYFPKGYLPLLHVYCHPAVVTIHDTIIQYDEDHYPDWRPSWAYRYWAQILIHTLRKAECILTVSQFSRREIIRFMERHEIPIKEISVTYEPCAYEGFPQPDNPSKEDYMIHLASREPHKRTAHLIQWWIEAEKQGRILPQLHLIGQTPDGLDQLISESSTIQQRPFLEDDVLRGAYCSARALILPSEIEGFGLPTLEAYYMGTPVCFVRGTAVEEILRVATDKGGFSLDCVDSLFSALEEVVLMSPEEVRDCGLKLREKYAVKKVVSQMVAAFHKAAGLR